MDPKEFSGLESFILGKVERKEEKRSGELEIIVMLS